MTDCTHFYGERPMLEAARKFYAEKIPGKRTVKEVATAAIPARLYFVMAILALIVAVAAQMIAMALHRIHAPAWLATEAQTYATIFRAMPLWFLIGGALSQVAARLNTAIDHIREWLKSN